MRFFFLVVLLAGLALGVGYPLAVANVSGYEIGTFPLLEDGALRSAEVSIAPPEAPVRVRVAMQVAERFVPSAAVPRFRLTIRSGERLVSAQPVTFAGVEPEAASDAGGFSYTDDVATIDPVGGNDHYVFSIEPTAGVDVVASRVDVILNAGAFDLVPRAVPIGYLLIGVGFVGFIAMARRRRKLNRLNPPPSRWGRGSGDTE